MDASPQETKITPEKAAETSTPPATPHITRWSLPKGRLRLILVSALLFFLFGGGIYSLSIQKNKPSRNDDHQSTHATTSSGTTPTQAATKSSNQNPTPTQSFKSTSPKTTTSTNLSTIPTAVADTTSPLITQMTGPGNNTLINTASFCFPIVASDNISKYPDITLRTKFDTSDWTNWTTDMSSCFQNVISGNHSFSAQVRDKAGNLSEILTRNFTVDTIAPTISLTGPSEGSTITNNKACFTITIDDTISKYPNIQVRWKFDDNPWLNWNNNTSNFDPCFGQLADGNHSFSVQGKDESGNMSTIVTRNFIVNTH